MKYTQESQPKQTKKLGNNITTIASLVSSLGEAPSAMRFELYACWLSFAGRGFESRGG